jgi:hypothetical protein
LLVGRPLGNWRSHSDHLDLGILSSPGDKTFTNTELTRSYVGSDQGVTRLPRGVPIEIRLFKLTEELGEAAEAFVGMHRLNSRKGVCRSRGNLLAELGDVIITAGVAMTGVTGGDVGEARSHLEQRSAGCPQWLAMGHQQPRRRSHPPRPQDTRPAPRDNLTRRRPERLSG